MSIFSICYWDKLKESVCFISSLKSRFSLNSHLEFILRGTPSLVNPNLLRLIWSIGGSLLIL